MSGTVKIHGKEYKTVALRVQEFREKHSDFTIHYSYGYDDCKEWRLSYD